MPQDVFYKLENKDIINVAPCWIYILFLLYSANRNRVAKSWNVGPVQLSLETPFSFVFVLIYCEVLKNPLLWVALEPGVILAAPNLITNDRCEEENQSKLTLAFNFNSKQKDWLKFLHLSSLKSMWFLVHARINSS